MNVVAPAHLNIAFALLFWRIHSRPGFVQFMGDVVDNRFEWWEGNSDPGAFITERLSSALCCEGDSNIVDDLGIYKFFRNTKPIHAAFKVQELVTYIIRSKYIDYHLRAGLNTSGTYQTMLEHLAADSNVEPFFHTPLSIAKFISMLALFFYRTFVGKGSDDVPLTIYDPNPGYGEITWAMANVSNKEMNIAYTMDSVGEDSINLPKWCYRFMNKNLKQRNCFNPLDSFNQIDIVATNPIQAWLPQYYGFRWKTIYEHIGALKEGAGVYVTTCPIHMLDGQPMNEDERRYKMEVICGRFLKIIVKLPPCLLRGSKEAPVILVFANTPQKHRLHCLDLTECGIRCSRDCGRELTKGEFNKLFSPYMDDEGYKSLFAQYKGDVWNVYGCPEKMRIGSLDDVNELLMDGIKLDDVFFNR